MIARVQFLACLLLLLLCGWSGRAGAQDGLTPADQHPWGRFPAGSWKKVRVCSEAIGAAPGESAVSTSETTTTLTEADGAGYTLKIEVQVEVGGKKFASEPRVIHYNYDGQTDGKKVFCRKVGGAELVVDGQRVRCETRNVEIESDGAKLAGVIYFSPDLFPYQLRRELKTIGAVEGKAASTNMETISLGMPCKVLGEVHSVAYVKTTHLNGAGGSVTMELHCDDVPGAVVAHSAQDHDAAGKVTRRSTLELVDYGLGNLRPDEAWKGRRRFGHRHRGRKMDSSPESPRGGR